MITRHGLARILHEEFKRDQWGDIEPHLFLLAALPAVEITDDADEDSAMALAEVLQRVVTRLNAGER